MFQFLSGIVVGFVACGVVWAGTVALRKRGIDPWGRVRHWWGGLRKRAW